MTIYLDNAAGTLVRPEVNEVMNTLVVGNPSSIHSAGIKSKALVESARKKVMTLVNAEKLNEIVFTGSGTESINLAIQGVAKANKNKGKHIITSKIEHDAVLETCHYLESEGFTVTYLDVDSDGFVDVSEVEKAITPETILITIMYANNEVGTIQYISEIGQIAKKHNVYFHTDACQAGLMDVNVDNLNVDLMTLNGSKINGPQGIGMLYVKENVKIQPLIHGGKQEYGLRSGTENIRAILGFAKALELAQAEKDEENKRLSKLQQKLINSLLEKIPQCSLNGHLKKRLSFNINVNFSNVESEQIVKHLSEYGIYASSGSACTSQSMKPSHVLEAMNVPARNAVRFTLGRETREEDIDQVLEILPTIIQSLREVNL